MSENPTTIEKPEKSSTSGLSLEWLLRGTLTRLGDIFDNFTRRKESAPSSLATSQLVERLKRLLDSMVKVIPEKGRLVPHIIRLRIQWDKFATDENDTVERLQNELLTAAIDHINDSQYYTLAPIDLKVIPDYFTDGVRFVASFDSSPDGARDELNVTIPVMDLPEMPSIEPAQTDASPERLICWVAIGENAMSKVKVPIPTDRRITVGRSGSNNLSFDDPSLSKFHASISITIDGAMSVADTGSTNGTFINGARIAYGKSVPFEAGDVVKFGTVEITFAVGGSPRKDLTKGPGALDATSEPDSGDPASPSVDDTPLAYDSSSQADGAEPEIK